MNTLVIFAAVVGVAVAQPIGEQVVSVSQSSLGDYHFQYATPVLSRSEHRNVLGHVNGGYSYIDPNGQLRKITYTADETGFHAVGSGVPVAVKATPEIAIAKSEHVAVVRKGELTPLVEIPKSEHIEFARKNVVVESPVVASSKVVEIPTSEHIGFIRKDVGVASPVIASSKVVEIPQPVIRSAYADSYYPVVGSSVFRIVPIEGKYIAAHHTHATHFIV